MFENDFESIEIRTLFLSSERESVQESIVRRISMLNEIIKNKKGIMKNMYSILKHIL